MRLGSTIAALADLLTALMLAAALAATLASVGRERLPVWRDPRDPPALHRGLPASPPAGPGEVWV